MKVRALTSFSGIGFAYNAGEVFELPADRERWLTIGFVAPLERETEAAAMEPPEKAVMPRPRKRAGSSK